MSEPPPCPQCQSAHAYPDQSSLVCPESGHEWAPGSEAIDASPESETKTFKDANGNLLEDGDTVVVVKDLKLKGASSAIKAGTKVKDIRLVDGDHDIDCKIKGFGAVQLKTQFVKKAK